MKYLLIVNPISGNGNDLKKTGQVLRFFTRRGHHLDIRLSEHSGHAETIAREACGLDYDVIIGAGGDGTINEVVNGMIGSQKKLAIIPWGTGNVFAGEMGFPRRLSRICRMILHGNTMKIDIGRIRDHHFLLMVGIGIDAYSLRMLDGQGLKQRLGRFAYLLAALRAVVRYRFPQIEVTLDDGRRIHGGFVLVANTSHYGNVFSFTPRARPNDGFLDVFVYRERNALATVLLAIRTLFTLRGAAKLQSELLTRHRTYRCTGLKIEANEPAYCQVDGDYHGQLPVEISLVKAALNIILPRKAIRHYLGREHPAGTGGTSVNTPD
jgi:YegS/Rv2252/BmrU family lipid kinase